MLAPKKQKYRKVFRGKNRGNAIRGSAINFGEFALKAVERGIITSAQIEASRKAIAHFTKREGKIWIRIFPDYTLTSKAAGTRMGAGKGDIKGYAVKIAPGRILFELSGVSDIIAREALIRASAKLPLKTKFLGKV